MFNFTHSVPAAWTEKMYWIWLLEIFRNNHSKRITFKTVLSKRCFFNVYFNQVKKSWIGMIKGFATCAARISIERQRMSYLFWSILFRESIFRGRGLQRGIQMVVGQKHFSEATSCEQFLFFARRRLRTETAELFCSRVDVEVSTCPLCLNSNHKMQIVGETSRPSGSQSACGGRSSRSRPSNKKKH